MAETRRRAASVDVGAVVTQWQAQNGYGFVQTDDNRRAYLHRSAGILDAQVGTRLRVIVVDDARNPGKFAVQKVVDIQETTNQYALEPMAKRARIATQAALV